MNITKKEHKQPKYFMESNYLWNIIVKKIKFNIFNINETNIEGKIIYTDQKNNNIVTIIGDENILNLFNLIYVVDDIYMKNRYFIGFIIDAINTDCSILGLYLFNNLNKNVDIILQKLCDFDWRNGNIDDKNTIIYYNSIIFYQKCRDKHCLILYINNVRFYLSEIKAHYPVNYKYDRYLSIKQHDNKCVLLDLKSIINKKELSITSYELNENDVDDFIYNNKYL